LKNKNMHTFRPQRGKLKKEKKKKKSQEPADCSTLQTARHGKIK
jgi:hypothetical protein